MAQNNGVEIIKGHMATNSDSDSSFVVIKAHNCGEAVLCTLYKCTIVHVKTKMFYQQNKSKLI